MALLAALGPVTSAQLHTYRGGTASSAMRGQCAMPGQVEMASSYCCSTQQDLLLLTKQDCEDACNSDDNCVAFSWSYIFTDCNLYDATALSAVDDVVGSQALSPPQGDGDTSCYVKLPYSTAWDGAQVLPAAPLSSFQPQQPPPSLIGNGMVINVSEAHRESNQSRLFRGRKLWPINSDSTRALWQTEAFCGCHGSGEFTNCNTYNGHWDWQNPDCTTKRSNCWCWNCYYCPSRCGPGHYTPLCDVPRMPPSPPPPLPPAPPGGHAPPPPLPPAPYGCVPGEPGCVYGQGYSPPPPLPPAPPGGYSPPPPLPPRPVAGYSPPSPLPPAPAGCVPGAPGCLGGGYAPPPPLPPAPPGGRSPPPPLQRAEMQQWTPMRSGRCAIVASRLRW